MANQLLQHGHKVAFYTVPETQEFGMVLCHNACLMWLARWDNHENLSLVVTAKHDPWVAGFDLSVWVELTPKDVEELIELGSGMELGLIQVTIETASDLRFRVVFTGRGTGGLRRWIREVPSGQQMG